MTAPAPRRWNWEPGPVGLLRLIAVAAVIACLLAGFIIAFGTLSANDFQTWTAVGLVSAGVFGACLLIL